MVTGVAVIWLREEERLELRLVLPQPEEEAAAIGARVDSVRARGRSLSIWDASSRAWSCGSSGPLRRNPDSLVRPDGPSSLPGALGAKPPRVMGR